MCITYTDLILHVGVGCGPHPSPTKYQVFHQMMFHTSTRWLRESNQLFLGGNINIAYASGSSRHPPSPHKKTISPKNETCVPPRNRLSKPSSPVLFYLCGAGWRRVPKPKNPHHTGERELIWVRVRAGKKKISMAEGNQTGGDHPLIVKWPTHSVDAFQDIQIFK